MKSTFVGNQGRSDNRQELFGLERCAADQSAVDVGHRKDIPSVAGLDAAAVQNAQPGRNFSILAGDPLTNEIMHFLGLLGGCRAPGADRPDRLVSDHGR